MYYLPPPIPPHSSYVASLSRSEVGQASSLFAQADNYNNGAYTQDVYGSDVYGSDNYSGTNNPSKLINTGTVTIFIITVAAMLILSALVVRFWKRPTKKKTDQETK